MQMGHASALPDPEEVLQHLDWVRGLAVRLVGDPAEADDLRQEVWLLSQGLVRPRWMPVRGWLSGLLRNKVRDRRRAALTRARHEDGAALERARSMELGAVVREVSLHQVVVARLMQLREPYRATLLARYFEDLSHGEIATRDGVSLATVRSRLQRGLAELREDLGQRERGHASVLALLAYQTWDPAALAASAATSARVGLGVGAWTKTAAVSALVVSVAVVSVAVVSAWRGWRPPTLPSPPMPPPLAGAPRPPRRLACLRCRARPTGARRSLARDAVVEVAALDPRAVAVPVQVVDLDGRPVAGVEVFFLRARNGGGWAPGPASVTDADGRGTVTGITGQGMVACQSPGHLQLAFPNADERAPADRALVVVLAPATVLRGVVMTAEGAPLEGVALRFGFLAALPEPVARHLDHANHAQLQASSDPEGRFELQVPVCAVPMGWIAQKVGFDDALQTGLLFEHDAAPIEVTMRPVEDPNTCFGVVVSEHGEPVAGAWVADGTRAVRAAEDGTFQLGRVPDDARLWVGAPGYAAREVARAGELRGLELVLGGEALTTSGRVLFPNGEGAAGLELRLVSQQPAGDYYFTYGGRTAFQAMCVEAFALPLDGPVPSRPLALTGPDGAFTLTGLLPRDYDVEVIDPVSLQRLTGVRLPAGVRGALIEFPPLPPPVTGVVRTPDGAPLAGALVATLAASEVFRQGPQTRTDGDGRFRFERLVRGARVFAKVDLPWVHLGAVVESEEPLSLVVEPAARVRLTLDLREGFAGGARRPAFFYLRDAAAAPVPFVVDDLRAYCVERADVVADERGLAAPLPFLAPVRATELVLADGDGPLLVLPLELRPGQDLHLAE
ncbi:MAG: sigma factor-like helix-turn-helix DNA-binding protein [Planctomycetota bacterium]